MAVSWGRDDVSLEPRRKASAAPAQTVSWGRNDVSLTPKKGAPQTRTSQMLGFRKGLMKPWNKGAEWLESGAASLPVVGQYADDFADWTSEATGGLLAPSVRKARENQQEELLRLQAKGVRPGRVGEIGGEIAGTLPVALVTKNPYLLGAGQGALLSDADDAQGLLRDAATGAVLGKAGDVAFQVATPLVKRGVGEVVKRAPEPVKAAVRSTAGRAAELAEPVLAPVRRALPPKKVTATGPRGQAERYVRGKAAAKGLRSGEDVRVMAADEFANHPDVRAAELMGKEGEGILQALARQGGTTGDEATAAMLGRLGGTQGRIQEGFAKMGVDPATAEGDLIRAIQSGEDRAGGLFREALDVPEGVNPPGVWNDELAGIAADPMMPGIMEAAGLSAARRGGAREGLTYGDVDIPGSLDDLTDFVESGVLKSKGAAGQAAVTGGTPLLQFVGRAGGLKSGYKGETLGELLAMDADKWHVGKPFMNRLVGPVQDKARDLDEMAELAFDAGYFPERVGIGPPSGKEFLDILREELAAGSAANRMARGTRYARGGEAVFRGEGRPGSRPQAEADYYGETHPDELPMPEAYGDTGYGAPPPREPAMMQAPTAQAWDLTRRKLNSMVDWRPSTPLERNAADDYKIMAQRLTRALAGDETGQGAAIPGLRKALDASGDYIGLRQAYKDFTGALFSNRRAFKAKWDRLAPGSREGAKAALATEIIDGITNGRLKPQKFATADVLANLREAFGEGADDFLRTMQAEARLVGSGRRFIPDTGSPTQRIKAMQEELAAQGDEAAGSQLGALADLIVSQNSVKGGAMAWIRRQTSNVLAKAKSVGVPEETRNEIGRLMLMPKDEFAAFLDGPPMTEAQALVQRYLIDNWSEVGKAAGAAVRTPALRPRNEDEDVLAY